MDKYYLNFEKELGRSPLNLKSVCRKTFANDNDFTTHRKMGDFTQLLSLSDSLCTPSLLKLKMLRKLTKILRRNKSETFSQPQRDHSKYLMLRKTHPNDYTKAPPVCPDTSLKNAPN